MKYIIYTLVLALTWAHFAPQVLKWVEGKQVVAPYESYGCKRAPVFYITELYVDTKVWCPAWVEQFVE